MTAETETTTDEKPPGGRSARVRTRPWLRAGDRVPVRPAALVYAQDERPPPGTVASIALQHVLILASYLVLPALVVASAGGGTPEAVDHLRLTLIAMGVASLLQCLTRGPVGSGYAVPATAAPIFFAASVLAMQKGGIPLVSGMTLFAGVLMVLIGCVADRLKALLPTEVTGVIVVMVGFSLAPGALRGLLTAPQEIPGVAHWAVLTVAGSAFAAMVVTSVQRGAIRRQGILVGAMAGTLLALALGVMRPDAVQILEAAPVFSAPQRPIHRIFDFDWALAVPFAVAAIASVAKSTGDLTIAQRANDADWVRPDMGPLRRGLLAAGFGNVFSGLIGGMGLGTATACVGMTIATGVTSRVPVIAASLVLVAFGCSPVVAAAFQLIPTPVTGAMMLFVACFIMVSGLQLLTARMLNGRRTFVVGTGLALGIGAEVEPELFHELLGPALASGFTLAALAAIGMNLLLMIGASPVSRFRVALDGDIGLQVAAELERLGGAWGARRDVVRRVGYALTDLAELLASRSETDALDLELAFDEYSIRAKARFAGSPLEFPTRRPTEEELLDHDGHHLLAGHLIARLARSTSQRTEGDRTTLFLRFEH